MCKSERDGDRVKCSWLSEAQTLSKAVKRTAEEWALWQAACPRWESRSLLAHPDRNDGAVPTRAGGRSHIQHRRIWTRDEACTVPDNTDDLEQRCWRFIHRSPVHLISHLLHVKICDRLIYWPDWLSVTYGVILRRLASTHYQVSSSKIYVNNQKLYASLHDLITSW